MDRVFTSWQMNSLFRPEQEKWLIEHTTKGDKLESRDLIGRDKTLGCRGFRLGKELFMGNVSFSVGFSAPAIHATWRSTVTIVWHIVLGG